MMPLAKNKKAYFDYEILEELEAGLILTGQEVKSIRLGRMQLAGSYVIVKQEELWLVGSTVPPYQPKNIHQDYDPQRPRKLLMKQEEIKYLIGKSSQKGLTLIPLKAYNKSGRIKLAFGIVRRRKTSGKKELLKKRAVEKDLQRELRARG